MFDRPCAVRHHTTDRNDPTEYRHLDMGDVMELLTKSVVRALVRRHVPPCISLYQPTHRHHPDNQQDPIRFKNLVRTVEESLRRRYTGTQDLIGPLHALTSNAAFWNHTLDGLAVLAAPGIFRVFRTQRPVNELAIVADSFHLTPLLRQVQSDDRYHVLCVTRESARVFEGNRDGLDELDPEGLPADIEAALGEQRTKPHQTVASYGTGTGGPGPMFHGHGSRKDEVDKDTERYFRAVDRAMITDFSKPSGLPVVLAALPEHQPVFRSLSQNGALLGHGVEGNPEAMSTEQLREGSWRAVEPHYLHRLAELSEAFSRAMANQRATSDLAEAASAAIEGRVSHLILEADRVRAGRIDALTGAVMDLPLEDPEVGDMLDDLAEAVLRTGGDVVVAPTQRMPSTSGLAAILRY
jgi:Bacterial archaeo-eukaryotic release factor family 3